MATCCYCFNITMNEEVPVANVNVNEFGVLGNINFVVEQIMTQGGGSGTIDTQMSDSSTNAVQNKVIKEYVDEAISGTKQIWYGTSSTAAGTAAKVVTTTTGDFTLGTGVMVRVKFTNGQTYNGTATLKVDGATAKNIAVIGSTTTSRYYWQAGEVVDFVYDGTRFVMSRSGTATTTYYGLTKLASSIASGGTLPVTGGAIYTALGDKANTADLATVATSGSYNDLTNKPTIPSSVTDSRVDLVNGQSTYPLISVTKTTVSDVSGVVYLYDDGSQDGLAVFIADGVGLNTVKSAIEAQIPTDAADIAYTGSYPAGTGINTVEDAIEETYNREFGADEILWTGSAPTGPNIVTAEEAIEATYNAIHTPKTTVSGTTVTQALTENTFYVFGEVTSLTVTLATPADANIVNEYHFRFTSGSTATTLSLPQTVTMPSGWQVEASKTYEISIVDNYGTVVEW